MVAEAVAQREEGHVLRQIIEASPVAILMFDEKDDITFANLGAELMFGRTRAELLSTKVVELLPRRIREKHRQFVVDFFREPEVQAIPAGRQTVVLRKNRTEVKVEIGVTPMLAGRQMQALLTVVDLTERLMIEELRAAQQSDDLRRSILDSLPFSIIASEPDGTIVTANPAAERLLGFAGEELVGTNVGRLRDGGAASIPLLAIRSGTLDEREVEYLRKDGSYVPVNEAIALIVNDAGDVGGFLAVAYDITQRREAEAFIRHMAHYDHLTDLPNRATLFDRLDAELARATAAGDSLAVILLDLDHFKRVNDSLGHHVGDTLLVQMAARLRSLVRGHDMVARLGGDEFVIVLTGALDEKRLGERIAELLEAIPEPFLCNGHELTVTASMGGALFPYGGTDSPSLLKHADTAMYHAKSAARNSFQWFEKSMLDATNDKLAMAAALRHALDRGEIKVAYQPQIDLATGDLVGVEALSRWTTADGVAVSPARHFPS